MFLNWLYLKAIIHNKRKIKQQITYCLILYNESNYILLGLVIPFYFLLNKEGIFCI